MRSSATESTAARDSTYPTVIRWPEGWQESQIASRIAEAGVMDEPSARLCTKRPAPLILGCFDSKDSKRLTDCILAAGGDAFAPSLASLALLGSSMKVRDMRLAHGNLEVDIWRGLTTTIDRKHVQFLVRATIRREKDSSAARVAQKVQDNVDRLTRFTQYDWATRISASRNIAGLREQAAQEATSVSEVLDIHLSNGTIFQVDGDKFAYNILGEMKGHSDRQNMDRLADLIAHISPDEVVDTYYPLFRPPPGHHRLLELVPEMRRNNEHPGFAFYSRWAALMYRHVMGK